MKNILILILLLTGFKTLAQDPQLLSNSWYLQKVIIDEVEYDFPFGGGTAEIDFTDTTFNLSHPICEEGFPTNTQYIESDSFTNENGGNSLVGTCEFPTAVYFQRHYLIYLEDDYYTAKNPFSYVVTTTGDQSTLVVTNVDGDQAIYGDQQLANESFLKTGLTIFPNPVRDVLSFSNLKQVAVASVKVYDVFGKAVLSESAIDWNNRQMYVSTLLDGVYFIKVLLKSGEVFTTKFVKI